MSARLDTESPWKGSFFYEDFQFGVRAKHMWECVEESFGSEHELSLQLWRTNLLNIPQVDREARTETTLADGAIVSVRKHEKL